MNMETKDIYTLLLLAYFFVNIIISVWLSRDDDNLLDTLPDVILGLPRLIVKLLLNVKLKP